MRARLPIVLLVAALLPSGARAFVRTSIADGGVDLSWSDPRTLTWTISEPADGGDISPGLTFARAVATVQTSFDTWQAVACTNLSFGFQGPTARIDVGFSPDASDNINLVVFRSGGIRDSVVPAGAPCLGPMDEGVSEWPGSGGGANIAACADVYNCWEYDGLPTQDVFALTVVTYNTATGIIVDADTELNASDFPYTATAAGLPKCGTAGTSAAAMNCIGADLQNVETHEIGHYLGMAHSLDMAATMAPTASIGDTNKRVLSTDDIDGICSIYPRWTPPPSQKLASGCASTSAPGAIATMLLWSFRRRRRA